MPRQWPVREAKARIPSTGLLRFRQAPDKIPNPPFQDRVAGKFRIIPAGVCWQCPCARKRKFPVSFNTSPPFLSFAIERRRLVSMSERQASSGQAQRAAREKSRQSSLADAQAQADKPDNIDRMVAQAFDSDPKMRLRVAEELGRVDDPRAIFALVELSSDKEEPVKLAAQRSLEKFKKEEGDAIVSLEKLCAERKEIKKPEEIPEVRLKMMPTLEKLSSHYEPKKRESAKRKLMPSLQKLFGFGPV